MMLKALKKLFRPTDLAMDEAVKLGRTTRQIQKQSFYLLCASDPTRAKDRFRQLLFYRAPEIFEQYSLGMPDRLYELLTTCWDENYDVFRSKVRCKDYSLQLEVLRPAWEAWAAIKTEATTYFYAQGFFSRLIFLARFCRAVRVSNGIRWVSLAVAGALSLIVAYCVDSETYRQLPTRALFPAFLIGVLTIAVCVAQFYKHFLNAFCLQTGIEQRPVIDPPLLLLLAATILVIMIGGKEWFLPVDHRLEMLAKEKQSIGMKASIAGMHLWSAYRACTRIGIPNVDQCSRYKGQLLQEEAAPLLAKSAVEDRDEYSKSCQHFFSYEYCSDLLVRAVELSRNAPNGD